MEKKKLYRIREGKKLSGVCGGLAEYCDVDATLFRVGWALATAFTLGFVGIIAYVVCAIVIPEKPEDIVDV